MSNRAAKYEQLHKSLKKHFKTLPEPGERSVLEHLLYACCLEDAKAEQADEAFAKLQQAYFDWNEVRVTTVIELAEALVSLPIPSQAGHRIKRCLQSLFEARYQYDIDDLKKANLSKATEEMTAWKGVTPFMLNYVAQNALGGHAIPVDTITLEVMVDCEILTQAEAEKKSLPGVERAIPKNKGCEFASLLHQFAIEFHQHPKNATALAVFKDLGVSPKPKSAQKPAAKKDTKAGVENAPATTEATSTTAKTKTAQTATETAKKAGSEATMKKVDKATPEISKSKGTPPKADTKSEKAHDTKKKTETKTESKSVKEPVTKKDDKAEPKPAPKKDDQASTKKPSGKPATPASKSTSPKTPGGKSPTKDVIKKPSTPVKGSKPESEPKKSAPIKKTDKPSPSSSKKPTSVPPTKKKPR